MKKSLLVSGPLLVALVLFSGCAVSGGAGDAVGTAGETDALIAARLPLYGHRNWIVVTDSAYPAQSAPGIETVVVSGPQEEVVRRVLAAVKAAPHVRPKVYLDAELAHVPEKFAPGISAYRAALMPALGGVTPETLPHEAIIRRLDETSKTFRVLIIKTRGTLAYSSVFIELNCGYWSDEAERALRADMAR